MKTITFIVTVIVAVLFNSNIYAQEQKSNSNNNETTEVFDVSGKCSMCKMTIEKAAKTEGVKTAVWDIKTHKLTVVYDTTAVKSSVILENIAKAGYDSKDFKADANVYQSLPGCCKYR